MKIKMFLVIIIIMLFISGCAGGYLQDGIKSDTDRMDECVEVIIDALKTKNRDSFKSVLSVNAKQSADLEEGIDYSFDLINEQHLTVTKLGCPISDRFDSGVHIKWISGSYIIDTNSDKSYSLNFTYYIKDETNPGNKGINTLKILEHGKDGHETYIRLSKYNKAGVYNPQWDEPYITQE